MQIFLVTVFDFLAKKTRMRPLRFLRCYFRVLWYPLSAVLSSLGFYFWIWFFLREEMLMSLILMLHWGIHELHFFLTSLCRCLRTYIWFAVSIYLKTLTMFCGPNHILAVCYIDYFETSLVVLLLSSFWERMEVLNIEALAL